MLNLHYYVGMTQMPHCLRRHPSPSGLPPVFEGEALP
jgi:hypothetical protein